MSTDIFNANPSFGGAFAMDEALLTFAVGSSNEDGGLGQLVQSVQANYTRSVNRIYELGPAKLTYYVIGRAEGNLNIGRLAAPAPIQDTFLKKFSNVCNINDNTMSINANPAVACEDITLVNPAIGGDGSGTALASKNISTRRYTFSYCLINAIAFQMNVQSLALTENLTMTFAKMSMEDESSNRKAPISS